MSNTVSAAHEVKLGIWQLWPGVPRGPCTRKRLGVFFFNFFPNWSFLDQVWLGQMFTSALSPKPLLMHYLFNNV